MNSIVQTRLMRRVFLALLGMMSLYELWLVGDRWFAAVKYRLHFGPDAGPWVSLGRDSVFIGFASLLFVCMFTYWQGLRIWGAYDIPSRLIAMVAFVASVVAICALLVLVILPTTTFR